uniref:Uncharacterized protein n=1 Tax=Opuntia streptacantha TaxID=393608 RepID=A0A7C9CWX5_OPUST
MMQLVFMKLIPICIVIQSHLWLTIRTVMAILVIAKVEKLLELTCPWCLTRKSKHRASMQTLLKQAQISRALFKIIMTRCTFLLFSMCMVCSHCCQLDYLLQKIWWMFFPVMEDPLMVLTRML